MFKLHFDFLDYYDNHLEDDDAMKQLGTTNHIDYHIEYFKAGFHATVKKWLYQGCPETPQEMVEILESEYKRKEYTSLQQS